MVTPSRVLASKISAIVIYSVPIMMIAALAGLSPAQPDAVHIPTVLQTKVCALAMVPHAVAHGTCVVRDPTAPVFIVLVVPCAVAHGTCMVRDSTGPVLVVPHAVAHGTCVVFVAIVAPHAMLSA